MQVSSEKAARSAVDVPVVSPGRRVRGHRLSAPYPGVEQTSSLEVPGAWRIGRKIGLIVFSAAALWAGAIWLITRSF